jgi:DNA-binding NarL/FixJ family response regulator
LLGASLPLMNGLQILGSINSEHLRTRVVFISTFVDDSTGTSAMAGRAYGVIPQDATAQFLIRSAEGPSRQEAADRVFALRIAKQPSARRTLLGVPTQREHQIVRLLGEGPSSKEMGHQLYLSEVSIKAHLHWRGWRCIIERCLQRLPAGAPPEPEPSST